MEKYPQTPHLPWSNGIEDDDKVVNDLNIWKGREIIVTEKLDGEHLTVKDNDLYLQYRILAPGFDDDLIKYVSTIQKRIPAECTLQGEYLLVPHSIEYKGLNSKLMFYFAQYKDSFLDWDLTDELFRLIKVRSIPILYRGKFDMYFLEKLSEQCDMNPQTEGFVIRNAESFKRADFALNVAKYVRKDFKQVKIRDLDERKVVKGLVSTL